MTSKERWRATIAKKGVDHIPTDYWGTPEITDKLLQELKCKNPDELWAKLNIDRVVGVGGDLHDPHAKERGKADIWGMEWRKVNYANGAGTYDEIARNPLAKITSVKEMEDYPWPDPKWWTFENVLDKCLEYKGRPIQGSYFEPMWLYSYMRGMEQAMSDFYENPEMVEAALERIFQIHYELNEKTLIAAKGNIDIAYIAEDLGTQESLLYSPAIFRKFLKPRMKKMMELVHKHGAYVMTHSDGAILAIIPDLVEIGVDILNPIQWRCAGMDRQVLKKTFGAKLCFHGAMDNQQTLPFGTVAEVRQEVRDNIRILGEGGGYILSPCHNIQSITPVENIVAMYDEARKAG